MNSNKFDMMNKAAKVCDEIQDSIKKSNLDFSIHDTPYSSYIIVRKKFQKKCFGESGNLLIKTENKQAESVTTTDLQEKIKNLENENQLLKAHSQSQTAELSKHNKELNANKEECDKMANKLKEETENLLKASEKLQLMENEKNRFEKELNNSKEQALKSYRKEIHDLKKIFMI